MRQPRVSRSRFAGIAGLAAGALAGLAAALLTGTAVAQRLTADAPEPFLEVTHLPPLLTVPGEPVALRYDAYCSSEAESDADTPCKARGAVFVRAGGSDAFRAIALREDTGAREGRFVALVPDDVARSPSGFAYYAVVTAAASGKTVTLPAAGADAPQRSLALAPTAAATLPAHVFGRARTADRRVVEASWGAGPGQVGLEENGSNSTPIGGSSFDVSVDGTVHVLDEANRRLLRWRPGARGPEHVPLAIDGTLADMSVAGDGTVYVLETAHERGRTALLRTFSPDGAEHGRSELAERAAQVRIGPSGPVVLQSPSGQWMSATGADGGLSPAAQRASGSSGRPVTGGREVVVFRDGDEIRAALVGRGGARRTWRIASETPLAEVQLAEPMGDRLVVVVRTYTEHQDEFVVLVLGPRGVETRFSRDAADWAETAPLSRFRLVGRSLYQLGSTPAGLFVDRIDLEVKG